MKKFFLLLSGLLLTFSLLYAQKQLTIEDVAWNEFFSLRPETLKFLQWRPNTKAIQYIELYSDVKQKSIDGKITNLLSAKDLGVNYITNLNWIDQNNLYVIYKNKIIFYNLDQKRITNTIELPENADQIFYNPQADKVVFKQKNNLFIADNHSNITQITFDTDTSIVNGGDYVHRQEFGIDHGIFWSPKGNYVAFYHEDMRPVADYPLIDFTAFPAKVFFTKYPMIGQKSEIVTLGIYDVKNNKTIYLEKKGDPEHYLTSISWDPSENYIYIAELNRDQNFLKLNKYDIKSGKLVKTLFTEKNKKYVEPLFPLTFSPAEPDKFIWFSQRDGYQHLYLYNTSGKLIKQLTKGDWVVTELYGFDTEGKYVYFQATKESPIQRHIYKVNIKNGEITKLTDVHGVHEATFSDDFKYFIDQYSNTQTPNVIDIRDNNGKKITNLLTASDPLKDYQLGKMSIGTITAADGKTPLYYRLILPPNFDEHKKYPALIYVYGGPHAQLITDSWLGDAQLWLYYIAQQGYVVFTVDNRGSYNRGFEFESITFRHLGIEEMKDQLQGVKFLASLGYVDTSRIGVHGWSFGGYMTLSLLTTYPNVFKVGVAGGPVVDWKYYEVMYGERYMDTPEKNPNGFQQTSILNKIQNLKGHLLIIHGMIDPVVVPQHTMQLLLKAQKYHIPIEYYPYPKSEHGVMDKDSRIHLYYKITNYFNKYLLENCK